MKVFWIVLKDLRLAARDRRGLMLLLAMPLILIAILGSAFSGQFENTPKIEPFEVGVVDLDGGQMAETLFAVLNSEESKKIIIPVKLSEAEVNNRISAGKLSAAILIPAGFSNGIMQGTQSTALEVLKDPTQTFKPLIVESICRAFVNQVVATQTSVMTILRKQTLAAPTTSQQPLVNFNPAQLAEVIAKQLRDNYPEAVEQVSTAQPPPGAMQYYSAAMGVMFLLFSGITGMQSIDADRRELTLARTFASPTSATTYLLGKFFGTVAIAFSQFIILAVGTALLFKVDWGAPLTVLSVAFAYAWAVSGMALALASLVTNNQAATGAWSILVQVFSALGGSMIPLAVFPPVMRTMAQFTPNYWGLQGLLAGMQNGPFPWSSMFALLALGTATLLVGSFRMRA